MTYALETRAETKTRQMLEANEIKVIRKIVVKTKVNRIRNQQRESCSIQPINEWMERRRRRRREWDEHETRMDAERLVKISSSNFPSEEVLQDVTKRRWWSDLIPG